MNPTSSSCFSIKSSKCLKFKLLRLKVIIEVKTAMRLQQWTAPKLAPKYTILFHILNVNNFLQYCWPDHVQFLLSNQQLCHWFTNRNTGCLLNGVPEVLSNISLVFWARDLKFYMKVLYYMAFDNQIMIWPLSPTRYFKWLCQKIQRFQKVCWYMAIPHSKRINRSKWTKKFFKGCVQG